jgi:NAD(P)-dependent dehydrogenase (short-subunit alcohol dehydrogenase family)
LFSPRAAEPVRTGIGHSWPGREPEAAARIEADMARLRPAGRVGQPEEGASAVAFLLSDEASFINGAILPVNGGRSALGQDPEEA